MKKLNIDNWFFRTMALIGDWVLLSVLWVIGCLPVVTAGAATLSVFAVAHKMAAGQDYAVCRDFCKAFRRDFRQATVIWLPMLALALLAGCAPASVQEPEDGKLHIVATVFPAYDFARAAAGDLADVELLLPPGTDIFRFH